MKDVFLLAMAVILTPAILLAASAESSAQSLSDLSVQQICRSALNLSQTKWDQSSEFREYVAEAARRGLTVDFCHRLLAQSQESSAPTTSPQSTAQSLLGLTPEQICRSALNPSQTEWEKNVKYSEYVAEANRRGLTVGTCNLLLASDSPGLSLSGFYGLLLFICGFVLSWVGIAWLITRKGRSVDVGAPGKAAAPAMSDYRTDTPVPKVFITRDGKSVEMEAPDEAASRTMSDFKTDVVATAPTENPNSGATFEGLNMKKVDEAAGDDAGGEPTLESTYGWALRVFSTQDGGVEAQQILRDWAKRLRKKIDPTTAEYRQRISDAVAVLEKVREGIAGTFWLDFIKSRGRTTGPRPSIWAWPNEAQIGEWSYRGTGDAGLIDLDEALAAYFERPWLQSDAIDISAINAFLVTELSEMVSKTGGGAPLAVRMVFLAVRVAIMLIGWLVRWVALPVTAVALVYYEHYRGAEIAAGVFGLYVLYRLFTIPVRLRWYRLRKKAAEAAAARYTALVRAWQAARGSTVNPAQLKALVLAVEQHGPTLSPALHAILERAIKRDATVLTRVRWELMTAAQLAAQHGETAEEG